MNLTIIRIDQEIIRFIQKWISYNNAVFYIIFTLHHVNCSLKLGLASFFV